MAQTGKGQGRDIFRADLDQHLGRGPEKSNEQCLENGLEMSREVLVHQESSF